MQLKYIDNDVLIKKQNYLDIKLKKQNKKSAQLTDTNIWWRTVKSGQCSPRQITCDLAHCNWVTGQGNGETTTSRQLTEVSEHVHHTAWLESSTVKQGKAVTEIVVLHIDLSFCFFQ